MSLLLLLRDAATLNAAYRAIITEAEDRGDTLPVAAAQTAGSDVIKSLQDEGVWDMLGALWVHFYPSTDEADFSLIEWKDPDGSYSAVEVNTPAFSADGGWQGSAASNALKTNLDIDSAGYNKAISVYVESWPTVAGKYLYGCGGDTFMRVAGSTTDLRLKHRSSAEMIVASPSTAAGLRTMVRDGGNIVYYEGGTVKQTSAVAENSTSGSNFSPLAFNSSGLLASDARFSVVAVWQTKPALADVAAFNTAINTYRTAIAAI